MSGFAQTLRYGPVRLRVLSQRPIPIQLPLPSPVFPITTLPEIGLTVRLLPREQFPGTASGREWLPPPLARFYARLDQLRVAFLPPERHCNRWYRCGEEVRGVFPYPTDQFALSYVPGSCQVSVYGGAGNLNRVILDLLSAFSDCPPLHGAAVAYRRRAFLLLADSGRGKTRLLQALLRRDPEMAYVADEEIFWRGDRALCCGRHVVAKEAAFAWQPQRCYTGGEGLRLGAVFVLAEAGDAASRPPVLFPFIARQSFWGRDLLPAAAADRLPDGLEGAYQRYLALYRRGVRVPVDLAAFSQTEERAARAIRSFAPQT